MSPPRVLVFVGCLQVALAACKQSHSYPAFDVGCADDGAGTKVFVDLNFKLMTEDGKTVGEGVEELFKAPFEVLRQDTQEERDNEYNIYPRLYGEVDGRHGVLEFAIKTGRAIRNVVGEEFLLSARADFGFVSTPGAPTHLERAMRDKDGRLVLAVALGVPVMPDLSIPLDANVSGPEFTTKAIDLGCPGKTHGEGTAHPQREIRGALSFSVGGETFMLRQGEKRAFTMSGRGYWVAVGRVTLPADGLTGQANFNIFEDGLFIPE